MSITMSGREWEEIDRATIAAAKARLQALKELTGRPMRTKDEIETLLNKARSCEIHDYDRQGGIIEALKWVLGEPATGGLKDVIDLAGGDPT